ncbi:MAG: LamG-like jellyroll fold domain-containing protein [Bacteroidales bacterium]
MGPGYTEDDEWFVYMKEQKIVFHYHSNPNILNGYIVFNEIIPLNVWTHIGLTVDFINLKCSLYVNGTYKETLDLEGQGLQFSSQPFYLGTRPTSNLVYKGLMDDVILYDRVLDSTEIKAIAKFTNYEILHNDTLTFYTSDKNFIQNKTISYYFKSDTIKTINNYCDSIVNRYHTFSYKSISVTDTLFITLIKTQINANDMVTIKVYPNPAKEFLYIDCGKQNLTNTILQIIDTDSKKIFVSNLYSTLVQIKVNEVFKTKGLYFIQILDDKFTVLDTKKIIIN